MNGGRLAGAALLAALVLMVLGLMVLGVGAAGATPRAARPHPSFRASAADVGSAPASSPHLARAHGKHPLVRLTRARVGAVAGGVVLCLALLAWASGYGLLGGRIVPLSRPLRKR